MHVLSFVGGRIGCFVVCKMVSCALCRSMPALEFFQLTSSVWDEKSKKEFLFLRTKMKRTGSYGWIEKKKKTREFFMYFAPSRPPEGSILLKGDSI
jgi:hypothetical protein